MISIIFNNLVIGIKKIKAFCVFGHLGIQFNQIYAGLLVLYEV